MFDLKVPQLRAVCGTKEKLLPLARGIIHLQDSLLWSVAALSGDTEESQFVNNVATWEGLPTSNSRLYPKFTWHEFL